MKGKVAARKTPGVPVGVMNAMESISAYRFTAQSTLMSFAAMLKAAVLLRARMNVCIQPGAKSTDVIMILRRSPRHRVRPIFGIQIIRARRIRMNTVVLCTLIRALRILNNV